MLTQIKSNIELYLESILLIPITLQDGGKHCDWSIHMVGLLKKQRDKYGVNLLCDPNTGVVVLYDSVSWNGIEI